MKIGSYQLHAKVTLGRVLEACEADVGYPGFCVACGAAAEGVEPDARGYACEACGESAVYGAEELLLHLAV